MTLPEWLSIKPASTEKYRSIREKTAELGLHTVCIEAHCPNASECWSGGTATFMVLGDLCTRGCRFCAVQKRAYGKAPDSQEPEKLAALIEEWGLDYAVITSVCRDDLEDQGAGHFASCVRAVKRRSPDTIIEVLIPDFRLDISCLESIIESGPEVLGHNIESVERLSPDVRDRRASYAQSLSVLRRIKEIRKDVYTKSAIMLGMGESEEEVLQALLDLRESGVDFLAMGQYLRPSQRHLEVKEYISPEKFARLGEQARKMGFLYVAAGPFVRSSYKAGEYFAKKLIRHGR